MPEGRIDRLRWTRPHEPAAIAEAALALPGVRGLAVCRSLLYPDDGDLAGAVDQMAKALGRS